MRRFAVAIFSVILGCDAASSAVQAPRTREIVTYDNVAIDLIAEGSGPLVVLLPSRGRDSEDFDEVAAGIAGAGFRVLRPSAGPRARCCVRDRSRKGRACRDRRACLRQLGGPHDGDRSS
jgi:hypothetical protein